MKNLIPLLVIPFVSATPAKAEMITINVNRVCATIVDIPYASDNFSDEKWEQFKDCVFFMEQFDGIN